MRRVSAFIKRRTNPRITLGAWMAYGLGAETEELPRFVVMTSVSKGTTCGQIFTTFTGSGFPHQAPRCAVQRKGIVLYAKNPKGEPRNEKIDDSIAELNHHKTQGTAILKSTRISRYEMAFKIQARFQNTIFLESKSS